MNDSLKIDGMFNRVKLGEEFTGLCKPEEFNFYKRVV